MQGILAGILTSVDVIGLYVLIPNIRYRLLLSVWTAALHMLFPLLGFELGNYLVRFLLEWGQWISSILLFCIGLHLLLFSHKNEKNNDFTGPFSCDCQPRHLFSKCFFWYAQFRENHFYH